MKKFISYIKETFNTKSYSWSQNNFQSIATFKYGNN